MTPFEQAAKVYAREHCVRSFTEDVELHFLHGFVHSTPDFFIMGRPVVRCAAPALILDPKHKFSRSVCDSWMVYLAAGDLAKAWQILPWPLPWLVFERNNELRFVSADAIKRLSSPPAI